MNNLNAIKHHNKKKYNYIMYSWSFSFLKSWRKTVRKWNTVFNFILNTVLNQVFRLFSIHLNSGERKLLFKLIVKKKNSQKVFWTPSSICTFIFQSIIATPNMYMFLSRLKQNKKVIKKRLTYWYLLLF